MWEKSIALSYSMLQPNLDYSCKLERPATTMGAGSVGGRK